MPKISYLSVLLIFAAGMSFGRAVGEMSFEAGEGLAAGIYAAIGALALLWAYGERNTVEKPGDQFRH